MLDTLISGLKRQYLAARQQYWHVQALLAYLRAGPEALPTPRFVLFGRGRSGTTALISMLDDVPALHCEGEILHNFVCFPLRHVLGRSIRSPRDGYGCKILSYQIRDVQTRLDPPEDVIQRLYEKYGFHILYLRRTNLLRHALSNIRARREQFHQKKTDEQKDARALQIDPEHVLEWMQSSEALGDYEQQLLSGVPYLSLTYEEHIRDPEAHQETVDEICSFLNVQSAPVESDYEKRAPKALRDRVANYEELARRLRGTPYESYLE